MFIWIIALAWLYVVLMMALAESLHPNGGWLGAIFTFLLYGVAPLSLVMYLMGTPLRRQRQRAREALLEHQEALAPPSTTTSSLGLVEPDASRHAPGDAAAAEGKEAGVGDGTPVATMNILDPKG
jgi:hypothetical protein